GYPQDGRSAFSQEVERRRGIAVETRNYAHIVRIGLHELQRRRAMWRRRWARLFGTGAASNLLYGDPWARAYRVGPHRELLDRRVRSLRLAAAAPGAERASAIDAALYRHVSKRDPIVPPRVAGPLGGGPV